jgi:hypothetical protein
MGQSATYAVQQKRRHSSPRRRQQEPLRCLVDRFVDPWRSAPDKFWLIAHWPTQKPESIKTHSAAKLAPISRKLAMNGNEHLGCAAPLGGGMGSTV